MFGRKPIIAVYHGENLVFDESMYLNRICSKNDVHSFRCPNKMCGRGVKIGYSKCPFCGTRLKWKYPFKIIDV